MGDRLSDGSAGLALLANSIATGAGLTVLIMMFSPSSGANFNPLISLAECLHGRISKLSLTVYLTAQLLGAVTGVIVTHLMFSERG